jgi:hypothetical protein
MEMEQWRTLKPELIYQTIQQFINKRLQWWSGLFNTMISN